MPLDKYDNTKISIYRIVINSCLAGLAVGIVILFILLVVHTSTTSKIFEIKEVRVYGANNSNLIWLKDIFMGKNIFTNINSKLPLVDNNWVISMNIVRALPDKLLINVVEDYEVLRYRLNEKCWVRTALGRDIPQLCVGNFVNVKNATNSEFQAFIEIYKNNILFKNSNVTLDNGFFLLNYNNVSIIGTFEKDIFEKNYSLYKKNIKPLFSSVESVDLTIGSKIYIKGVLNEQF